MKGNLYIFKFGAGLYGWSIEVDRSNYFIECNKTYERKDLALRSGRRVAKKFGIELKDAITKEV